MGISDGVDRPSDEHIVVRRMSFDFSDLPRHWFAGDPVRTHAINGLHVVFPAGERFFIRSVRHYEAQLPESMRPRVRAFYGQEAQHQVEHRRAFAAIEATGLDVQSFLEWYERLAYEVIEPRVPPHIRLAVTAALEHYTATMALAAFDDELLDEVHPIMRDLLRWHAAEEIEHKSVTFDVLTYIDPRWSTRAVGFVLGTAVLGLFWGAGVAHFLRQEPPEVRARANRSRRVIDRRRGLALVRAGLDYLRPGFHPDENDDRHLAEHYLRRIGRWAA